MMQLLTVPFRFLGAAMVIVAPIWCFCAVSMAGTQPQQTDVHACHSSDQPEPTTPSDEKPASPCSNDCNPCEQMSQDMNVAVVPETGVASYDLLSFGLSSQVLFATPATPVSRIASRDHSTAYHGDSLRALSRLLTV